MVLGLLAAEGPMHGHRIRRTAEMASVDRWGGVSLGALNRELRRMEEEGLVEPVRSEQVGRRPTRTIHAVTEEGRRELVVLRERALRHLEPGPDPVGVALMFAGGDPDELRELLGFRRRVVATALDRLAAERARSAGGGSGPLGIAVFRRGEHFLAAELAWHEEVDSMGERPGQPLEEAPARVRARLSARGGG